MKTTPPTKLSLKTCAELFRAADTTSEQKRILLLVEKHGHSVFQLCDYLAANPMLSCDEQAVLVFAARYAHNRKTYAAGVVIAEIKINWTRLDEHTQRHLVRESNWATENVQEWADFRQWTANR